MSDFPVLNDQNKANSNVNEFKKLFDLADQDKDGELNKKEHSIYWIMSYFSLMMSVHNNHPTKNDKIRNDTIGKILADLVEQGEPWKIEAMETIFDDACFTLSCNSLNFEQNLQSAPSEYHIVKLNDFCINKMHKFNMIKKLMVPADAPGKNSDN